MADVEPDLLLLDIRMSPINGVEFLSQVRATRGFSAIPAIAVTALAHDAERQTFLAAGFHSRWLSSPPRKREHDHLETASLYALQVLPSSEIPFFDVLITSKNDTILF